VIGRQYYPNPPQITEQQCQEIVRLGMAENQPA
jgi:hypothetical protein